ncbi:MAG: quinone oxidoreductase family protein [Alphaproteobacteria bacterium]
MTKAIIINEPGGYEALKPTKLKDLKPAAGQVLIAHKAIGINFIDVYYRRGDIKLDTYPIIPGIEAAGYIEEIGEGVEGFKVGDRVAYATLQTGGAYSEKNIVDIKYVIGLPDEISFEQAAASLTKGMTAHYLLRRTYYVRPGNYILINAAAGGVGQILSQWAREIKANIIGAVGSDDKIEIAKKAGCDYVINYSKENLANRVMEITNNQGVVVAYDSVGGDMLLHSLECLGKFGLLVSYGQSSGSKPLLDLSLLVKKSLFVTYPNLFVYKENRNELILTANEVFEYIKSKVLKVNIANRYTLEEARKAHQDLEERKTTGSSIFVI